MTAVTFDQSIEDLQTKISYLESAVGELSDVVFRQQREMQALKAQIELLRERIEVEAPEASRSLEQERPPHY
jgi:SlyX protein